MAQTVRRTAVIGTSVALLSAGLLGSAVAGAGAVAKATAATSTARILRMMNPSDMLNGPLRARHCLTGTRRLTGRTLPAHTGSSIVLSKSRASECGFGALRRADAAAGAQERQARAPRRVAASPGKRVRRA